ncbi:MAG: tyrosine-protein phosphatase [Acidobacteriota bacterium]|jgi:protein tyrosine/serine phosphatase|nr:tyrosine-protein phosphatase [Acidobacteriota bacterium]
MLTSETRTNLTLKPVGYWLGRISLLIIGLLLLSGLSVVLGQDTQEKSLPRFYKVNDKLYRGAQPLSGGIERLKALGIKTIINLRSESEGTREEETDAKKAKLAYFNVPLAGLSAPSDEDVEKILALINDVKNQPVFVHCNHGKDRTGTIVAVYRISHDGWTSEDAKAEAKRFGMSWVQFKMKAYISDYYEKHKQGRPERKAVQSPRSFKVQRSRFNVRRVCVTFGSDLT